MSDIAFAPATNLADRIRRREITAAELLDHCIDRLQRFDGDINAVVVRCLDEARTRAGAADAATAKGESWGPLHGVPVTVKECFDLRGTPSTWGITENRGNIAVADSVVVERLLAAGAIVFGKTNVPYMLADWQSFNEIYGTTNNPWDPRLSPGGSSGGASAALAAGMTALEVGTDIGGSIRNPAHYCGVYGHKPTYGIVPMRGARQPGLDADADISVAGPLARDPDDLETALNILAGPDRPHQSGWRLALPPAPRQGLMDFRAAVMLQSPVCAQDGEMTGLLAAAISGLEKAGLKVDWEPELPVDPIDSHQVFLMLMRSATSVRLREDEIAEFAERARKLAPGDKSYAATVARAVTMSHRDWLAVNNRRAGMTAAWQKFFDTYDIFLCPAAASAACPHDHAGQRADRTIVVNGKPEPAVDQLFWAGYSGLCYLPSTVAPAGFTAAGLPVGLQIVAAHLADRTAIHFARLMRDTIGGFLPPAGYD